MDGYELDSLASDDELHRPSFRLCCDLCLGSLLCVHAGVGVVVPETSMVLPESPTLICCSVTLSLGLHHGAS